MYKLLSADKDTYITNRIVCNKPSLNSNVGVAGTLDLFKLYGLTFSGSVPNVEISRLLLHFDLTPLQMLVQQGKIDFTNSSFNVQIKLSDVYGGQPTPRNFSVVVNPLSASFDEGLGKDVVYYSDFDVCNFLTASYLTGAWYSQGCSSGAAGNVPCDYFSSMTYAQSFKSEEDLCIDVTQAVSATLAKVIPDAGFRIALSPANETDTKTYFVKRFASRSAYDKSKHPKMIVKYDDSIQDNTQSLYFDTPGNVFLYSYMNGQPTNLLSGTSYLTGTNCVILNLSAAVSGGVENLQFTGSQYYSGINPQSGIYYAQVVVPSSNSLLLAALQQSSSVQFTQSWSSVDGTVNFPGNTSVVSAVQAERGSSVVDVQRFLVSVYEVQDQYSTDEQFTLRVNIFDYTSPNVFMVKTPMSLPGIVVHDVHYQVKNQESGEISIPFDTTYNSTRCSSDAKGMYFKLDTSNMAVGSYSIDILIKRGNVQHLYNAVSPIFRICNSSTQSE